MHANATTTGPDTQLNAVKALDWAINEMRTALNPPPLTRENQLDRLLALCRELADHLNAYAISSENFDEDAFWSCRKANTLLFESERLSGQPEKPQGHSEEDDDEDVCGDCRSTRSEAEADEGWNPDAGQCFSCAESVYRLCEKFNIFEDVRDADRSLSLDILRAKLWEARKGGPISEQIMECLTFSNSSSSPSRS